MQADALKRWLPWLIKLVISVSLIGYLLTHVDLAGAWSRAPAISPFVIFATAAALAMQTIIWAVRWTFVVNAMGKHLPVRQSIPITFAGLFFNQFLPASVGADLVRMWQSQRAGLPVSAALNGVVLERAGNVLTVCVLAAATSLYWKGILNFALAVWVFPLIALCGVAAIAALASIDRLPRRWFERRRMTRGLVYLSEDTRKVFLNPHRLAGLTALAVLGQCLLAFAVYLLATGMNIGLTLFQCFVLMPPVVILSSLPISVAGWGVREVVMMTALGFMGVEADVALLLSVILAALVVVISLPGGLIWLVHRTTARTA